MNQNEIQYYLFRHILENDRLQIDQSHIDEIMTTDFVGFDRPDEGGWYANGKGHETRIDGEASAPKYCLCLSDTLDSLMYNVKSINNNEDTTTNDNLFDVGLMLPGEELEDEYNKFSKRMRRRRTMLAIGHGDFMSIVLKRLVGGYVGCGRGGRLVEQLGRQHRTVFIY